MAITHRDIVTTGLTLLRQYGLADLSMRRIAKELGVQPGALYWHVKNKQELLVALARELTAHPVTHDGETSPARPTSPDGSATTSELVVSAAQTMIDQLAEVPDGAEVVQLAYALEPESVTPLARLREALTDRGADADIITNATAHLVLGELIAMRTRALAGSTSSTGTAADAFDAVKVALLMLTRP